jgi:hypothetical protein
MTSKFATSSGGTNLVLNGVINGVTVPASSNLGMRATVQAVSLITATASPVLKTQVKLQLAMNYPETL